MENKSGNILNNLLTSQNYSSKQVKRSSQKIQLSDISCIPRILIACGHSLCQRCLCSNINKAIDQFFQNDQILSSQFNKCHECNTAILNSLQIVDLQQIAYKDFFELIKFVNDRFPINQALINLKETFDMIQAQPNILQNGKQIKQQSSCDQDQDIDVEEFDQQLVNYDPQFRKIQDDFKAIQVQNDMENELYSKRQKLITYMTQHSDEEDSSDESNFGEGIFDNDSKDPIQSIQLVQNKQQSIIKGLISPIKKKKSQKCKTHQQKKIEAFCENCKTVLCISCILQQQHKGHEMVQIEQGAKAHREYFFQQITQVFNLQNSIENQILNIQNHMSETENQALKQQDKISQVFNEIRQRILVREQLLKKRLSEMLESEQALFKKKIENLKDQIKCINDLEQEKPKIQNETDIQVLQKCKLRHELLQEAQKEIGIDMLLNRIPIVKKEEELACIVSLILPKKLREKLLIQNNQAFYKLRKPQSSLETA